MALREELKEFNVKVHLVVPMYVSTNMTSGWNNSTGMIRNILCPNAETYVESAIKTIGMFSFTNGYWMHCFQVVYTC
jgi:short-subunit dehydrogenase